MTAVPGATPALVRDSPVPLHYQLRRLLLVQIEQGWIRAGEALPPERELAAQFGVSLAPVRQALLDLVSEGVLYRVRGRGTFLREPPLVENVSILASFSASMRERGLDVEMRLLRRQKRRVSPEIADALGTGERVAVVLERLALIGDEPVGLFRSHLSPRRFPDVGARLARKGSLWSVLEEDFGVVPVRAGTIVGVDRCTTEQSSLLHVPPGSSLLIAQGTSYDAQGRAVELFHVCYRPDRIRLGLDSFRSAAAGPQTRKVRTHG